MSIWRDAPLKRSLNTLSKKNKDCNINSKAFVQLFELSPYRSGTLSEPTFGVKDLIDIAGYKTGGGNPTWENSHPAVLKLMKKDELNETSRIKFLKYERN